MQTGCRRRPRSLRRASRRASAASASTVPAIIDRITTASGPSIEVRAPTIRRERMSRPCASNPSRKLPSGPTNARVRSTSFGGWGASAGPKMAQIVATAMIATQITPSTPRPPKREVRGSSSSSSSVGARPGALTAIRLPPSQA